MMGGNSSSFVFHWRRTNICILADVYDAVMFLVTHFKSKNIKSTTRRSTAHFIFLSTITVHIIIGTYSNIIRYISYRYREHQSYSEYIISGDQLTINHIHNWRCSGISHIHT